MARIRHFSQSIGIANARLHTDVECGYRIVGGGNETLLQLDTYGSDERQIPGKVSQSIQIDRTAAAALLQILWTAFPELRDRSS
jgi:hypothetical protein